MTATEDEHLALVGLLNSSTACFWMKQVFMCKGLGGQGGGIKPEDWHRQYEFDITKLKSLPLPNDWHRCELLARRLDKLAKEIKEYSPDAILSQSRLDLIQRLSIARSQCNLMYREMTALQEELDWLVYALYNLAESVPLSDDAIAQGLHPEDRPVEILLREKLSNGELSIYYETQTFRGAESRGELHPEMQTQIKKRLALIRENSALQLIETINYKRRWQIESWDSQVEQSLRAWLLNRLETYFDFDGRMNDDGKPTNKIDISLISIAQLADQAPSGQ